MDYRETLNLPKTNFPMKANLPVKEPSRLEEWESVNLYQTQRKLRQGAPKFVLHDGPPYANGDIHAGTALNKILKDMINRYWTLAGYDVVYVPGWDTHGLPIEMRALKKLGVSQHQIDPLTLRRECEAVARHYIGVMTEEFQRLGVMGAWQDPYITLTPQYEAAELRVFADLVDNGLIYRDLKAVYWCPHCETALAEGEIEYKTHRSPSIYVAFPVVDDQGLGLPDGTRAVIWTTTPWTIPANVAIALHPELHYDLVDTPEGPLLVAHDLVERVLTVLGVENRGTLKTFVGHDLEGVVARHPYLDRQSPFVLGGHVTAESGTGLVHTAPGHGVEDFEVGRQYGLPVIQPLDDRGRYFKDTPVVAGLFYADANPVVLKTLQTSGALLHAQDYDHQYAYCWRCKNPVIYRATSQWFLSIDRIRETLIEKTYGVNWDPAWGGDRMRSMVSDRNDWCLSRQRVWGLPIPAFYCEDCGHPVLDAELVRRVADIIGREGSNAWWSEPAAHFLPDGYSCSSCGSTSFRQEKDIFDVWMDSGSSQAAVLAEREGLKWPADLVLEGNDQYRGWFQSLLTTGVATRGGAPYQMVLTHGMVLDKSGQEMHKSLGNTIDPLDIVNQYGSDILRLWVATSDFRGDVRISDEILRQLSESYRKIRNTFRFLLGNLHGFDPAHATRGTVSDPLNRWALDRVNRWLEEAREAYRQYHFHTMVHGLLHLMIIDLSSFYLDVIKDRLYTWAPSDPVRVETQRVLFYILGALTRAISPVLVFTAEEVYQEIPRRPEDPSSVHLTTWMDPWEIGYTEEEHGRLERLLGYREVILKALEDLRQQKVIGNSLAGEVHLTIPESDPALTEEDVALLTEMALAAKVTWTAGPELAAVARPTAYLRCERCWRYTPDVNQEGGLCARCQGVLVELQG
ncbi:isoleucine--tRNA ligase [Sulfobacillus harzensis]|uniref:Isoleucine--tRNA ligase n=1 Tax=Sulfobacillus harzensis TaxID=2729629 RepID=A0A7Y0Q1S8_9FIRM|nr:isoleucine--tRNA ligase [Sulfobacillus harzensis]NMP21635.1 isoleucine--tRNA ligase [Sulfobacillus harzensis]